MITEYNQYYEKFDELHKKVSVKLRSNPSIEAAISYWSEYFENSSDKPTSIAKCVGTTKFQDFSCHKFYKELILSCNPHVKGILGKELADLLGVLKSELGYLETLEIINIFNETIKECSESQDQNYLSFLGFICIAISYPNPNQFSEIFESTNISQNADDFQCISKQYFKEIYECKDSDFDFVYKCIINLNYFDNFLKALVIETSKKIRPYNVTLSEDNVKFLKADIVFWRHLITKKFNPLLQNNTNTKDSFMDGQDIKKIALIVALVVGAVLTVGGAKYVLDQKNKNQKPKNNPTKDRTRTSPTVFISRGVTYAYILVLMLDFTDSVKDAVNNLRTNQENKLSKDTVSAISKLTVLQAIWHGRKDTYENSNLREIFDSGEFDDEHNLIFIEIEMNYHEYDFDKGAGLSNARDGLMKLVSNPNSYKIVKSKIVSRTASDPKLKTQISALYR